MRNFEPTHNEFKEAEAWVLLRLAAIGSFSRHLDVQLRDAVKEICEIVYRYNGGWVSTSSFAFMSNALMYSEIRKVLDRLASLLDDMLIDLASADGEEADDTDVFAMRERLNTYIGRFEDETEALVSCGLLSGLSESALAGAIISSLDDPWGSDLFERGKERALSFGTANSIILAGGISYGVGHSNVGKHMFEMMGNGFLTSVFGAKQLSSHPDATMFLSVTADSKACDYCVEEEHRGWQPISNYAGPWHPNCRCHFYFR